MYFTKRSAARFIGLNLVSGFIFGLLVAHAHANPLPATGADLVNDLELCREANITSADQANWRACYGYLTGIVVGSAASSSAKSAPLAFCLPADANDNTIQESLLKHLKGDKKLLGQPAHVAILSSMSALYPCE